MCRSERIWSLANCCRRSPHIPWTKVEKKTFHHTNRYFLVSSINRPIFAQFESIWVKILHFWGLDIIDHHIVPQPKPALLEACYVPCDEKFPIFSVKWPVFLLSLRLLKMWTFWGKMGRFLGGKSINNFFPIMANNRWERHCPQSTSIPTSFHAHAG